MHLPCETSTILDANWRATAVAPAIEAGQVHLWAVVLDDMIDEHLPSHAALLCPAEQRRAGRIRRQPHRDRYIVGRSLLRRLLGGYLRLPASDLSFSYNGQGKPQLAQAQRENLSFNLAHSGGLAIYAFARGAAVGIDLEAIDPARQIAGVAQRFFTPTEWQAMAQLDADAQIEAFYRIWTQKEAYVKALGDGLLAQIDQFDVAVGSNTKLGLQNHRGDARQVERWNFIAPAGINGYAAALATDGPCQQLSYMRWPARS